MAQNIPRDNEAEEQLHAWKASFDSALESKLVEVLVEDNPSERRRHHVDRAARRVLVDPSWRPAIDDDRMAAARKRAQQYIRAFAVDLEDYLWRLEGKLDLPTAADIDARITWMRHNPDQWFRE